MIIDNKSHTWVENSAFSHLRDAQSLFTQVTDFHALTYDGLPRIDMRIPMDAKMDGYTHTFIETDSPWIPSALDNEFELEFHNAVTKLPEVQE